MEEQRHGVHARARRCSLHAGEPEVGRCEVCRRPLCLSCAVPVRGRLFGQECLSTVLPEASPPAEATSENRRGQRLSLAGFGLVVLLSVPPWSRFGHASGILGAWKVHWSLLAVTAAAAGLLLVLWTLRRPTRPRAQPAVTAVLSLLTATGAILHLLHPPPLSAASVVPLLALGGGAVALAGALSREVLDRPRAGGVTRRHARLP